MRFQEECKILELLEQFKTIHYTELVTHLGLSVESCRHRCIEMAKKYPNNIDYKRGLLILKKSFSMNDLPLEKRLEALQRTLQTKEQIEEKLRKNHLPHLERAVMMGNLEKAKEELERLKRLYNIRSGET